MMVLTLPRLFEMREGGCCGAGGGGHPVFQPGSSRCCLSELRQVSSPLSSNIVKVSRVSRTLLLTSPLLLTPPPPSPPQPPPLPQVLGLLEEAARNYSRAPSIPSTSGPSPYRKTIQKFLIKCRNMDKGWGHYGPALKHNFSKPNS